MRLPPSCKPKEEPVRTIQAGAYSERFIALCRDGLRGREIRIDGLTGSTNDVLVRLETLDGSTQVKRLTPNETAFIITGAQSWLDVARAYFLLGVDHILSGYDHLLFVFSLVLLIGNFWMLAKTITAFTIAHSITLAGASLGYFSLPHQPVEACIALSIAFVASELARQRPGERRFSETNPWVVAFSFGLLHGFGFAGALKETGLPQTDVPLALLTFNLGVEAGQILFVALVLAVLQAARALIPFPAAKARWISAYAIGSVAMVWLFERVAAF